MYKSITLNHFVAQAGLCSRRKAVDLIKNKRIKVNGITIDNPGYRVMPLDSVSLDENIVDCQNDKHYILLNKPRGYVTTVSDEKGRKTVMDLISNAMCDRLFPVGRLDKDTEGLLLLTNDGDFAEQLAHPRYNVRKTYHVITQESPAQDALKKLKEGIILSGEQINFDTISYVPGAPKNHILVTLHSGYNRIIRRIFAHYGYTINRLIRVGYGPLILDHTGPKSGQWRALRTDEKESLAQ